MREMVASGYDNKAIQDALDKRRAADPARTRRELLAARQANTPWIPREVLERIPVEWGLGTPTKKDKQNRGKDGWRWQDPTDKGNGVRIDKGNPSHPSETQQEDHVIINRKGRVLGRDGLQLPGDGAIRTNPRRAHIPLREYRDWREWDRI